MAAILLTFIVKCKAVPLRHADAKGERNYSSYSFLTSALSESEWSASRPVLASPQGRTPSTHWIGGWVGLTADMDTEVRGKAFASVGDRTPVVQSIARYYTGGSQNLVTRPPSYNVSWTSRPSPPEWIQINRHDKVKLMNNRFFSL
jgi:hypothetical protein